MIRAATATAVALDSLNSRRDLPVFIDTISYKASEKSLSSAKRSRSLPQKDELQQVDAGLCPLDENEADRLLTRHEHVSPLHTGFCKKIWAS